MSGPFAARADGACYWPLPVREVADLLDREIFVI